MTENQKICILSQEITYFQKDRHISKMRSTVGDNQIIVTKYYSDIAFVPTFFVIHFVILVEITQGK